MSWEIRQGDALERLREMPDRSVQTCVTSPPYFGLRDYGTGEWEGGDEDCDHVRPKTTYNDGFNARWGKAEGQKKQETKNEAQFSGECGKCGARRVDQQVGLEQSPDEYVARLVEVFREVRRVLRDDGTLWLNLGDSYAGSWGNQGRKPERGSQRPINGEMLTPVLDGRYPDKGSKTGAVPPGYKPKDLLGIPWLAAFALRADGWFLRSDIVWNKPNPMPESVTDRPTKSHEYVFVLAKSPRYFFDQDAIREDGQEWPGRAGSFARNGEVADHVLPGQAAAEHRAGRQDRVPAGRNKRSVWTVATQPFPGAHFAVFPPNLIEPCVLAGSAPKACGECGAPWVRVTEWNRPDAPPPTNPSTRYEGLGVQSGLDAAGRTPGWRKRPSDVLRTVGWRPSCSCPCSGCDGRGYLTDPVGGSTASCVVCDGEGVDDTGQSVVLDPFAGAGTTGLVALQHGRSFIGIELNPGYVEMASQRIATAERLGFRAPEKGPEPMAGQTSIFDGEAA